MRRIASAVILCLGLLSPAIPLGASDDPSSADVIVVGNPALRASLERIYRKSATWRAELERAAGTGRRIVVLTADQVVVTGDASAGDVESFDPGVLAEVSVISGSGTRVEAVLVAVNLFLLDETHRQLGSTWSQRDADLDRILVHEVYGHALPYVVAGDVSGRCADPGQDERAIDACAIRRENTVRAELGLGRRSDPGLLSLALARY
ncbi:MAG: hypothetical protein IT183_07340 [Acidobacteria bacterium]|nr:hypothetical protein [Acidobacteriota bacterium]